jgi:alpha-glucosidase
MNIGKHHWGLAGLAVAGALVASAQETSVAVRSPNGQLELVFSTGPQFSYRVNYRGKPVIGPSALGLDFRGQPTLGPAAQIVTTKRSRVDETYTMVHGKSSPIRDWHNAIRLDLAENTGLKRNFTVEGRAYDDGIAFRYLVPKQPSLKQFELTSEKTQFRLRPDAAVYPLYLKSSRTNYEAEYQVTTANELQRDALIGLPLLAQVGGVAWIALTEAHLEDNAGLYLTRGTGAHPTLEALLAPRENDPEVAVMARTPHQTPWRVVMVAPEPGRLIESNIISNLNPPCALAETSWIRPGKAAWPWWSNRVVSGVAFRGGSNTETMKYYTDFAAKAGLEYLLVDVGWYGSSRREEADITRSVPEMDIPEVIRYAGTKGVKVWLWLQWRHAERQMEEAFALYQKWGVVGVKIDHMNRDDQWMVDFYHRVVRNAAAHHLMVDFHGAYKPTGLSRTYPNLLTQEGVMGLEDVKWEGRANPDNDTLLPFTRMLAGPMDYTPGGFDSVTKADFVARRTDPMVIGTRAHQLALYVVFESPFQMVCDHPSAYEKAPSFQFIQDVPTNWDETKVLNARVGDYITIARRNGKEWYVGSITDSTARDLVISLGFLNEGKYVAEIYADAPDAGRYPKHVRIENRNVDRSTRLKVHLAPGGGHAMRIRLRG